MFASPRASTSGKQPVTAMPSHQHAPHDELNHAYDAAITDDVAIFVDDTVDDPSVAMALTHSSVAVAMLSPARHMNASNSSSSSSSSSDDGLDVGRASAMSNLCFETPPSKEARPAQMRPVFGGGASSNEHYPLPAGSTTAKTPPFKESADTATAAAAAAAGLEDAPSEESKQQHPRFDRIATLRRFATDRTNTTAFGTPLRKGAATAAPPPPSSMTAPPPPLPTTGDYCPLASSQQHQTPGRYYHNLSLAEARRAPAPPPTPADFDKAAATAAAQDVSFIAASPLSSNASQSAARRRTALLASLRELSPERPAQPHADGGVGGGSAAALECELLRELEEEIAALRRENARLLVMHEHQKSLAQEAETQRQETDERLQAKIMEAVGLASRLDESKRFVRQLKKESLDARSRTLAMANGTANMLLSANAQQQQQLDEAQIERLVEPRVRAAVRNAEMRYLAVVRDQQDRIQALEELLGTPEAPMAKLASATLVRNKRLTEETATAQRAAAIAQERMNAAVHELDSRRKEHDAIVVHMQEQLRVAQRALTSERDYVDELLSTLDMMKMELEELQREQRRSAPNSACASHRFSSTEDEDELPAPPLPAPPPAIIAPRSSVMN